MSWLHPSYLWALALVPAVIALFVWAAWQRRRALARFVDHALVERLARGVSARRRRYKAALVVLGTALLALALAGPRYGLQVREVEREGVDLVIALDVSQSMLAEDVAPSRLERARNEIKKLLGRLQGDRVGLVIFAGDAFIQAPLTTDYGALRLFLDVAGPDLLATPGTDFGAALERALRAFENSRPEDVPTDEPRTRALLFVSDGENHATGIPQLRERAEEAGVVLFAAGVGETQGTPIPLRRGREVTFKRDRDGQVITTRLEEEALRRLAAGGAYFRVAATSSSLPELVPALDRLDRSVLAADRFESYREQYQWPLALGLLLLLTERLVGETRRRDRTDGPRTADDGPQTTDDRA